MLGNAQCRGGARRSGGDSTQGHEEGLCVLFLFVRESADWTKGCFRIRDEGRESAALEKHCIHNTTLAGRAPYSTGVDTRHDDVNLASAHCSRSKTIGKWADGLLLAGGGGAPEVLELAQALGPADLVDGAADDFQHTLHAPLEARVLPCLLHLQ